MSQLEREWQHLRELMEHMLQDTSRGTAAAGIVWHPPTDVWETEREFVVRMDLAGVRRDDVKITLADGELQVRGIRRDAVPPGKKHFYKMEITMGPFERRVPLPRGSRFSEVQATYRDGILEIRCQKTRSEQTGEVQVQID
jgi:HSP20 family protein